MIWRALLMACVLAAPLLARSTPEADGAAAAHRYRIGMTYRRVVPKGDYDWRGAQTHALTAVVWYPQRGVPEQAVVIPGLKIFELGDAAVDAPLAPKRSGWPLIVISHGTGGSALSMAWLGEALAAHGYIAAAVNHPGNNATEPYTVQGFSEWWERARDLSELISALLADPAFGRHIDRERIGAGGFSLGGYTMIEIAGGRTDLPRFVHYCDTTEDPGVCTSPPEFPTLAKDFRRWMREHPEVARRAGATYKDPRVRAVFAMAPPLGPAFPAATLNAISIPVLIVAGESDRNVPIATGAKYFHANIPGAKLHILPGAVAHYAFLNTCTAEGRRTQPVVCKDAAGVDRTAVHGEAVRLAVRFFDSTLRAKPR